MRGSERKLLSITRKRMATDFQFDLVVEEGRVRAADSVLAEAHALVARIEDEITEFRESSPVWKWNHSRGEWIEMPSHLRELLRMGMRYSEATKGYFDPFAKSKGAPASSGLEIDPAGTRFRRLDPALRLGFGAIGKGYALDAVRAVIEREGFTDYRLNCGGSSWIFSGESPTQEPWRLAWAWGRDADGDFVGRELSMPERGAIAIGISGTLEQGNHFLHRGESFATRVLSAFYAGKSAAEADAFSTALFIGASLEGDGILTTVESPLRNPAIGYVDLDGQLVYNENFQTIFMRA